MHSSLAKTIRDAYQLAASMLQESADAQDVIQDVAAKALSHKSAPDLNDSQFRPWFFKVVRNSSIDKLRQLNRFEVDGEDLDEKLIASANSDPLMALLKNELHTSIEEALQQLSSEQREIVLLKDYYDFSYADIATIMGIAKGTVMSKLHRSRIALSQLLLRKQQENT